MTFKETKNLFDGPEIETRYVRNLHTLEQENPN